MQNNQKKQNRTTNMGDNSIFNESIAGHFIQGNYIDFGQFRIPTWVVALVEHFCVGCFMGLLVLTVSNSVKPLVDYDDNLSARIGEFVSASLMIVYCDRISKKGKNNVCFMIIRIIVFSVIAFSVCKSIRGRIESTFGLSPALEIHNFYSYAFTFSIACILFAVVIKIMKRLIKL